MHDCLADAWAQQSLKIMFHIQCTTDIVKIAQKIFSKMSI